MAIKGLVYVKTPWSFEERPVASAKLNAWDDRIASAVEELSRAVYLLAGGSDGVLAAAGSDALKTAALAAPGLAVEVKAGSAFVSGFPYRLALARESAAVTPPLVHPRIDVVQAHLENWGIGIKAGAEAASPVAPGADADCMVLARLYLRPGMMSIKNTDDGVNGYIVDQRSFLL